MNTKIKKFITGCFVGCGIAAATATFTGCTDFLTIYPNDRIVGSEFWKKKSDVESIHCYFKPIKPIKSDKPIIVSEMGGYSLRVEGHYYNKNDNYGYRTFTDEDELSEAIIKLYEDEVLPYIAKGLCGNIYTQVSDVEDETNGFYTYDRKVCKVNKDAMLKISKKLEGK